MTSSTDCIFCRIASGEVPSRKLHEDDEVFAFHDIAPWAPVHFLIVPKAHIESLVETTPEQHQALLGRMLALAPQLARDQGITNGFRVVVNNGADGGQEVLHLHLHVIGGPRPWKRG